MRAPRTLFRHRNALLVSAIAAVLSAATRAAVPSFPGADGAAFSATGGSGGIVYHVTRLDSKLGDNGPGTFQYGINDSNFINTNGTIEPRTIVFDVGGTIWIGNNTADTEGFNANNSIGIGSNVTVAGQTAPGGITIAGGKVKVNGDRRAPIPPITNGNDIIRNVTFAAGYGTQATNSLSGYHDSLTYDDIDINSSKVMIDHVTTAFATDEAITSKDLSNVVTVQYTTIAQGQSYPEQDAEGAHNFVSHALGDLWSMPSNATSTFSHNLYAHETGRIPTIQTETSHLDAALDPALTDFRNNVVYNWFGTAGYGSSGEPGAGQFINNYYKVGPGGDGSANSPTNFSIVATAGGTGIFSGSSSTKVSQSGNVRLNLNSTTTNLTNSDYGGSNFVAASTFASVPYNGVTDSAATSFTQVTNYAGANWQTRDAIDQRLVYQVLHGTGKVTAFDDPSNGYVDDPTNPANDTYVANNGAGTANNEWNTLLSVRSTTNGGIGGTGSMLRAANYDTDRDGMPDLWEAAMGLNPSTADNNGTSESNGYTNLDNYLNELSAWPASAALVFNNANGTGRYAEIGNWQNGVFEPSRYDTAQVNSGTATIDVPGQHAGSVSIATASGNTATLSITGGWLDVSQTLSIGPGGTGTVTQSNGILRAGTSVILGGANNPGTYNLTGGTLATPLLTKGTKGGTFTFTGGALHADTINFSFTNAGGTIAPGSDLNLQLIAAASMPDITGNVEPVLPYVGSTHVVGNLTLQSGTTQIDLASISSFDTLRVDGALALGGNLNIVFDNGYVPAANSSWQIATAGSVTGKFTPGLGQEIAPTMWVAAVTSPTNVSLVIANPGDASLDGIVDTSDFTLLASHFNQSGQLWLTGDFNGDGVVNSLDFNLLASNFGSIATAATLGAEVPEPTMLGMLLMTAATCRARRRS